MDLEQTITNNLSVKSLRKVNLSEMKARGLVLARVSWPIYVALLMSLFIAALQVRYINLTTPTPAVMKSLDIHGFSTSFYAVYLLGFEILFALGFIVVAAIIYARNNDDWMGVFTAYTLVTVGVSASPVIVTLSALETANPMWALPVRFLSFAGWSMLVFFFYLFPDGRFTPGRARYFVIATVLIVQLPWTILRETPLSPWQWPPAWHIAALLATWLPAWSAQFFRYRRNTDPVKAQQTKWFVYGSVVAVVVAFSFYVPRVFDRSLDDPSIPGSLEFQLWSTAIVFTAVLLLPIGIAFSILRYKLWNIDIIINKTLVYVPLTGILAGLYAAFIKIFQSFFESLLGARTDLAVIMTTLLLASTFTPIKDALQGAVNKRFKGPPDPSEELSQLTDEMRLFVEMNNPNKIMRRVMEDVTKAFEAAGGAVYIERKGKHELLATYGNWNENATSISAPIECQGEGYGLIKLNARSNGEAYTDVDIATLHETVDLLASTLKVAK